jgi:DNA repair photolyase
MHMTGNGDLRLSLPIVDNKSILTATGGFLGSGFTHTINVSQGCSFALSACGVYCYAQHNPWITKGRPWGLYGFKKDARGAYQRDYDRIKRPRRGDPQPLRVYMSPSCDPYQPQEARLKLTRALLEEMLGRPPDVLVIQTRSPLVGRDLDLITALAGKCELWLSMTVETDLERVRGLPNHATPIRKRIATLQRFRDRGVPTQATVSPLLPLDDPAKFAQDLGAACDRVVLDHYLLGDGSQHGLRTKRTDFPRMLEDAGLGEWNGLGKFWEIKGVFDRVLGPDRVLISADGFNSVGQAACRGKSVDTCCASALVTGI